MWFFKYLVDYINNLVQTGKELSRLQKTIQRIGPYFYFISAFYLITLNIIFPIWLLECIFRGYFYEN
jgi:hypothetical protein